MHRLMVLPSQMRTAPAPIPQFPPEIEWRPLMVCFLSLAWQPSIQIPYPRLSFLDHLTQQGFTLMSMLLDDHGCKQPLLPRQLGPRWRPPEWYHWFGVQKAEAAEPFSVMPGSSVGRSLGYVPSGLQGRYRSPLGRLRSYLYRNRHPPHSSDKIGPLPVAQFRRTGEAVRNPMTIAT